MRARFNARQRSGQSLVEMAMVFPVFIAIIFGAILVLQWQMLINSAQFGTEVGIQVGGPPATAANSGYTNGVLCNAAWRTYDAIVSQSFLGPSKLVTGTSGAVTNQACTVGGTSVQYVTGASGHVKYECPSGSPPSYAAMKSFFVANAGAYSDAMVICAWSSGTGPGAVQVTVSVAGYKPSLLRLPLLPSKLYFYGQSTETLQEFTQ